LVLRLADAFRRSGPSSREAPDRGSDFRGLEDSSPLFVYDSPVFESVLESTLLFDLVEGLSFTVAFVSTKAGLELHSERVPQSG
jgi:hypothetical protein